MAIDLGNDPGGTPPTAGEKLQIRSAIGVGTTDAPTFLAQTLTGQSLTGTQATSLVDLNATWNTTGNPSLIYGRVTNTNSGTTANLIDLGTFAGGSLFSVSKTGVITIAATQINVGGYLDVSGVRLAGGRVDIANGQNLQFTTGGLGSTADIMLARDAAGILAQRNGTNAQAFRVYNSTDATPATNYDRASFGYTSNTLRIGTENGGTYTTARPIDFVTGGVVRMSIAAAGKIGIGTSTPVGSLDVRDANTAATAVSIGGTAANVGNFITLHGNATNGGDVRIYSNYNTTDGNLILGTYGNQTTLCIVTGGKVGVGSATTPSKLTVTSGDIEVATIASGLILKSPDGTRYRITVPNGGTVLTITAV